MTGRRRSERSQEAIINATIDILREDGFHALAFERVAQRAGVSKATVYRWWRSRGDLALDAVAHRVTIPPVKATGDIRIDLRAVVQATYDALVKTPLGNILRLSGPELSADPIASERMAEVLKPRGDAMRRILRDAADRGDLPSDLDETMLLDMIAGAILYRVHIAGRSDDGLVDQLTTLFLNGEMPRTPR